MAAQRSFEPRSPSKACSNPAGKGVPSALCTHCASVDATAVAIEAGVTHQVEMNAARFTQAWCWSMSTHAFQHDHMIGDAMSSCAR